MGGAAHGNTAARVFKAFSSSAWAFDVAIWLHILHNRAYLTHLDLLIPRLLQHARGLLHPHGGVVLVVEQRLHVALVVEAVLRELVVLQVLHARFVDLYLPPQVTGMLLRKRLLYREALLRGAVVAVVLRARLLLLLLALEA